MEKMCQHLSFIKYQQYFCNFRRIAVVLIFCLSFADVGGQTNFHLPPGTIDRTSELIKMKAAWTYLKKNESIDGYTRIGNSIFGGNINCGIGPLKNIDVKTFQVFPGSSYAKDKRKVYYPIQTNCVDYDDCGVCYFSEVEVKGAHPLTFKYLGKDYGNDCRKAFWRGQEIVGADASTFKVLDGPEYFYFSVDKNHVYLYGKVFIGADPKTFYYDKDDPRNVGSEGNTTFILADKSHRWKCVAGDNYATEIDDP